MESFLDTLKQKLEEISKKTSIEKELQIQKLSKLRQEFIFELDNKLNDLNNKFETFKILIERKAELQKAKISVLKKIYLARFVLNLRHFASAPFIYIMIVPAIILHIFLELYHQVCFRLYKIPRVKPKDYFVFDRHLLPYLNIVEKINCLYCSYFNCLIAYSREISGRTEKYWCPIKHAERMKDVHNHYDGFVEYLDGKGLREKWSDLRKPEGF